MRDLRVWLGIAAAALLLWLTRYEVGSGMGVVYRFDRWSGDVEVMSPGGKWRLIEPPAAGK